MEELIKLAEGFWDRLEEIIQEGNQEKEMLFVCLIFKRQKGIKMVSRSCQMKNRDRERKEERKIAFLEIDNRVEMS